VASGKPLIASRVRGIPWTLRNGSTGLITKNDADSMERALRGLLEDRILAKKMGEKGMKLTHDNHRWPSVVDQYEQVYLECRR